MSDVIVKPVATRRERSEFLGLPWTLYRNDPCWIPPLRRNQRELVGYASHPFHNHAECQTFLATRDGAVVGRVAAILNHAHNRRHKERRGFFGFFESVDDPQVAGLLLDAVRDWLAQRDITRIRGPVNPSMNYECGLLVDGFDSPPTFMMTYNPPYYAALIEDCGFCKSQDLFAFWGHAAMLDSLDKKLDFIVAEAKRRFKITLRTLEISRFTEEVQLFLKIYNESLGGTWGFVPLSEAEIRHIGRGMRHLIVPQLTSVAEVDGRPVAVVFGLLDYNPRIKQIDGRLFPFGFLRLLSNRRAIHRVRLISTNVVPAYQRWGVGVVALNRLLPDALAWGIQEGEFSWVLESNHLSRASLERGGAKLTKTYRIYDDSSAE